jgi:hypothetical protein
VVDYCEHGNKPSDFIKGGFVLDYQSALSASEGGIIILNLLEIN